MVILMSEMKIKKLLIHFISFLIPDSNTSNVKYKFLLSINKFIIFLF